jgi:isocitrate dehydrogenase
LVRKNIFKKTECNFKNQGQMMIQKKKTQLSAFSAPLKLDESSINA